MRLRVWHRSRWTYASPATLGPHLIRLRPASHAVVGVTGYTLDIAPAGTVHWQRDPTANHVARLSYPAGTTAGALEITVAFACDVHTINPFEFLVDAFAAVTPFTYPEAWQPHLAPYLDTTAPFLHGGDALAAWLDALPSTGDTVPLLVALTAAVHQRIAYIVREEAGTWTPGETLAQGRGSCRDSAVLLVAVLRSRGFAARFVSGYLIELADTAPVTGAPSAVTQDRVALHAWVEVYLPGAGWIGLDATSGLLCGEGHVPLACASEPALAAPVEGTSSEPAGDVTFTMHLERLEPVVAVP